MRWEEYFRDWTLLSVGRGDLDDDDLPGRAQGPRAAPLATCVRGIADEFATPGFRNVGLVAVANATGKNAPKTNVARSALEDTAEAIQLNLVLYTMYKNQIADEVKRLVDEEGYSLTWATSEIPFLLDQIMRSPANDEKSLHRNRGRTSHIHNGNRKRSVCVFHK